MIVIGSQIGIADRPVVTIAVVIFGFEFVVAEPERLSRPEQGTAAEEAHSNPVVGVLGIVSVRNFLFVDPGVGIELVGLK